MAGELMRAAVFAQPEWLAQVPTNRRLPDARVVYVGAGTSFHAAQTAGRALQSLEAVLDPPEADLMVLVSHEGETELTLEAAQSFGGEKWLVTGTSDGRIADLCREVVVCTPATEQSLCHTASYTCAVAALRALQGEDIGGLPERVAQVLEAEPWPVSAHERWLVAGAGRDWPSAQEAVLKLREGAFVAAEAHETEQLLHGHLAAVDETVRCFVLDGEGRAAERARGAAAALEALGCNVTLVATEHPVADIVRFQRLTLDLAAARGVDPDRIRRDDARWQRAADAHSRS